MVRGKKSNAYTVHCQLTVLAWLPHQQLPPAAVQLAAIGPQPVAAGEEVGGAGAAGHLNLLQMPVG